MNRKNRIQQKQTKLTKFGLRFLCCLLLIPLSVALTLCAQPTNIFTPQDEAIRDALGKFSLVKIFITPLVLVLVMAARKWIGLIPDQLWPWLAPFIGTGLDYVGERMGFWTGSVEAGLAAGGLAVWFSQLIKQTQEARQKGLTTTPDGVSNPPKVGLFFLIGCLAFGSVGLTGCTIFGKTPRTVAAQKFDTYKSVYGVARESYKTFKRQCFAGKVTAMNEALGDKAWNEFRIAYASAFRIGMDDVIAPENVIALKDQLVRLLLKL